MVTNSALAANFTSTNWDKKPWILLLLLFIIPDTQCEPHSLSYYYTGMSQSGRLKEFHAMTYVDDQEIMTCNQKKYKCRPVASWMKDKEDGRYWEKEHSLFKGWEKAFRENLLLLKHWFNNTNSLLILQLRYGCEIQSDGDIKVHYRYGFQGRDYSLFDALRLAWDPIMDYVQLTDEIRNQKRDIMESVESYLDEICPKDLNKYIGYGRDVLERMAPPDVHVIPLKVTDRVIKLQCLVYGFHPRAVDVKWVRNGVDDVPSEEMSPILPHPDGTYQKRVSMEVPTREEDTYSCHVDHSSLKAEIAILWGPQKNNLSRRITYFVIGPFVFCLPIFILLVYCCKYTEETSGDSRPLSKEPSSSSLEPQQAFKLHCTNPLSVVGDIASTHYNIILHDKDTKKVLTC